MLQVFWLLCKQQSSEVSRVIGDMSKFGSCSWWYIQISGFRKRELKGHVNNKEKQEKIAQLLHNYSFWYQHCKPN